ncbi:MAG: family 20 glycosylhydrolase [Prevotella sp.]|nr:family 20 glycosylhydrolase [Prevotella sp.]
MWKVIFLLILPFALANVAEAKINHLMPKPKQVERHEGTLVLGHLHITKKQPERITHAIATLGNSFLGNKTSTTPVTIDYVDAIEGAYDYPLAGFPNEAYSLAVTPDGISIKAVTETGTLRAIQTLAQLAEGDDGVASVECCTITDWPSFKLRGLMHDVGRSFISVETLERQIRLLSRFKVNTLHLHLTENQAWRFEVKRFPQLTDATTMTRFAGNYYTQEQCRALDQLAYDYGITIIPEIDMPGHSAAFERAMGHSMQSGQGVAELKDILVEVAATFIHAPYIHIGADEQSITYPGFLEDICHHVHGLGKRVVVWNPIRGVTVSPALGVDMTQMWSSAGKSVPGVPNIDCRYNYVNHFDLFADLVGIYLSNIYYSQRGDADVAGTITAVWNDRLIEDEDDLMRQNNVYANMLASAERAWMGGGRQYIEQGGTTLPLAGDVFDEFQDWERRFLFHKNHSLRGEPIPYVRQSQVCWQVTDAFPNDGDASMSFPPETEGLRDSYTYHGNIYGTGKARGAGIYLRHVWGTVVPGFFTHPQVNTTAYAWTWVYSPQEQQAGAIIEFQNYSRSEKDAAPRNGTWDYKGSRVWLNDVEILPPTWDNDGCSIGLETPLRNENATVRPPVPIVLKQGWNKVFVKLPFVQVPQVRLNKWMFTFVITDTEGHEALEGLTYSPQRVLE